jgi:spermidine/putrescine transport system permease protein
VPTRRRLIPYGLMGPGLIWLAVFFVVPMYFMGRLSLESGTLQSGFEFTWQWSNFSDAIQTFDEHFIRSFIYAAVATLLSFLIAYPLAYAIVFRGGKWRNLLLFLVVAPFFTTYLIRTIGWQTILSDQGFTVDTMKSLGLLAEDGRLLATSGAVIAGLTYNFLPFMILPIYASLERLDVRLIEAAKDLYSSSRAAFLRVTLPLSTPGIVAGTLLTFIPAAGDYVNVLFLGSPNQAMVGNVIQRTYLNTLDYPLAAATSFIFMAIIFAMVVAYIRFAGSESLMGEDTGMTKV